MEISAEINKIFGTEIAKIFAEQISEDEMQQYARNAWKTLTMKSGSQWFAQNSTLENMVEKEVAKRLQEQVEALLDTETVKADIHAEAEKMVTEIRKRTVEKFVEAASDMLAGIATGYGGKSFRYSVEEIVSDMMRR